MKGRVSGAQISIEMRGQDLMDAQKDDALFAKDVIPRPHACAAMQCEKRVYWVTGTKMDGADLTRGVQFDLTHSLRKWEKVPALHNVTIHGGVPYGKCVHEG